MYSGGHITIMFVIVWFYDCYVWPVGNHFQFKFTLCYIFKLMFLGRGQAEREREGGGQAGWLGAKLPPNELCPRCFSVTAPTT